MWNANNTGMHIHRRKSREKGIQTDLNRRASRHVKSDESIEIPIVLMLVAYRFKGGPEPSQKMRFRIPPLIRDSIR